jgi:hypothetical protein
MKRLLFLFLMLFLANTAFSQLEVKPGSFKETVGFVNTNPDENYQTDDNDLPFAVIKVRTENISDKQRRELLFEGNGGTFIMLEYKVGEVWVYLTAKYADYLKISHPEFSSIEFTLPCDLVPKHGYEMTLINKTAPTASGSGALVVTTKPETGATITLNGKVLNQKTPYNNDMIAAGQYEITVSKDRYKSVTQTVTIADGENKKIDIMMPIDVATITLTADNQTDVYVDGNLMKRGTWSGELYSGQHKIIYKKQYYNDAAQTITVEAGIPATFNLTLNPIYGKINITSEPTGATVYIDGNEYGVTPLEVGSLMIGPHDLKLIKNGCNTVFKTITLEKDKIISFSEILQDGIDVFIYTDNKGDSIFVDGVYVGDSPLTVTMSYAVHELMAKRGMKTTSKTIDLLSEDDGVTIKISFIKGIIDGIFSVSPDNKVRFSEGNLQYKASTNTWRFANNQWDIIGDDNQNISSEYNGWIDLFGWGTSGFNNKYPYMQSGATDYGDGINDISRTNYDWGVYNIILNGSGKKWRTLTNDEWKYLFNERSTSSGIRYAMAIVNGMNGVILLPDNWKISNYKLKKVNDKKAKYNSNSIALYDWIYKFEANGAVFLPAAGCLDRNLRIYVGHGLYWTASKYNNDAAFALNFRDGLVFVGQWDRKRYLGYSVRLVCDVE